MLVVTVAVQDELVSNGVSGSKVTVLPDVVTWPGTLAPPTESVNEFGVAVAGSIDAEKVALKLALTDRPDAPAVGVVDETVMAFDGAVGEDFLLQETNVVASRSRSVRAVRRAG